VSRFSVDAYAWLDTFTPMSIYASPYGNIEISSNLEDSLQRSNRVDTQRPRTLMDACLGPKPSKETKELEKAIDLIASIAFINEVEIADLFQSNTPDQAQR